MDISVLIVDDDPGKVSRISDFLTKSGAVNVSIEIAGDVSQARRALSGKYFDLMLLDILLPVREGGAPSGDVSVDFLRQIVEDESCPSPGRIVAITSDMSALDGHEAEFRSLVTQIIPVGFDSDNWMYSLDCLLIHMRASVLAKAAYGVDVFIQTALRDPELSQFMRASSIKWSAEEPLANGLLYQRGSLITDRGAITFACAHAPQMGLVSACHLTTSIIEALKPRIIIMTGICGAVKGSADLGDLVVADKSWDWQAGKWSEDGGLQVAPDQKDASADLVAFSRGLDAGLVGWYNDFDGPKPTRLPKLKVSPIASGSAVVADSGFHSMFKKQHRKVGGIDMECYGVYYACSLANEPRPKFICMKSVSDTADPSKGDDYQSFCSYLSARAAIELSMRAIHAR